MLIKEFRNLEKGFYLIKGKLRGNDSKDLCKGHIKIEYRGETKNLPLLFSPSGEVNFLIRLKENAKSLKIEASIELPVYIEKDFNIEKLEAFKAYMHIYKTIFSYLFSRAPATKELKKKVNFSLKQIIFKPFNLYTKIIEAKHLRLCGHPSYGKWLEEFKRQEENFVKQVYSGGNISFLILVLQKTSSLKFLKQTLDSLNKQVYKNFSVKVTQDRDLNKIIRGYPADYILFLEEGDLLEPIALHCFSQVAQSKKPDVIYGDNDFLEGGKRINPFFKPDWSPDYLLEFDYIQMPVAFKKRILKNHVFHSNYALILELLKERRYLTVFHIPTLLGTKLTIPTPWSGKKLETLKEFLGGRAKVESGKVPGTFRVKYHLSATPKVSIVIPTKDRYKLISKCLFSLTEKTDYSNYEIIVVDNGSTDEKVFRLYEEIANKIPLKVVKEKRDFNFSYLVNKGVKSAEGDLICLLNNDIEVFEANWLKEMVSLATRREVGVVGAKLLYPNNRTQHGGVILGIWFGPNHAFKGFPDTAPGYMNRLSTLQNYLAVTAACMVFRREVFEEVNGFDEQFAINFNDTDFCLRLYRRGYRIIWTPYAKLYHLESGSRRYINDNAKKELSLFRKKWFSYIERDPFYNPNLTRYRTDFSLGEPFLYCKE